jgi:molecular chaperone DnaJ
VAATRPDLYKALGVSKNATADEIKKAYRRLARENHPDRNPGDAKAEERFKEVQAAYDVLGDPDKRKQYDRGTGPWATGGGFGPGGFGGADFGSFSDILSDLFGNVRTGGRGGGGRAGGSTRPQAQRGRDLETEVDLSFAQAVEGAQVQLQVPTSSPCPTCSGTGAKPGTTPRVCPQCQGRGVEAEGQGLFSISQPCSRCGGSGAVIDDPCPTCHGTGANRVTKRYRVKIPAGVREGSRIRLPGKGEAGLRGGEPGDLYVVCHVADSKLFKRVGDHVEVDIPLTIPEAIRGGTIEVPTLNGRKKLRVKPGTQHGTLQRLRGEGPPKLGGDGRGDIRYRFVIEVPATLSPQAQAKVDELAEVMDGDPRAKLFGQARAA